MRDRDAPINADTAADIEESLVLLAGAECGEGAPPLALAVFYRAVGDIARRLSDGQLIRCRTTVENVATAFGVSRGAMRDRIQAAKAAQ